MSKTSEFSQCSCSSNLRHHSKLLIENLIQKYQDKTKVCLQRSQLWQTLFLLHPFLSESIWHFEILFSLTFRNMCLVFECVVTLDVHSSRNEKTLFHVKTNGSWLQKKLIWAVSFFDARKFCLCFQIDLQKESNHINSWNFANSCLSRPCKFLRSRSIRHSHKKQIDAFRHDIKTRFFALAGEQLERLESEELSSVHCRKILDASTFPGMKNEGMDPLLVQ